MFRMGPKAEHFNQIVTNTLIFPAVPPQSFAPYKSCVRFMQYWLKHHKRGW
jgi:hypothetical protein